MSSTTAGTTCGWRPRKTPRRLASAKRFWEFLPRSVIGSVRSAWRLEAQRLRRLKKNPWHPKTYWDNDVLNAWLMSVVLWGALIAVFGPRLIPFVIIQAVYGFSLLETVNYLEHYGLLRQKTANGRYERCTHEHSWNSDHIVTNLFLYHLQRHSDHHANPTRRYQTLRSIDGSPSLPSGYASMITLAYIPPLWRKVMDPRVLAHYDGDINASTCTRAAGKRCWIATRRRDPTSTGRRELMTYKLFRCIQCGFEYDEALGWPEDGIAAGTRWDEIPDDWSCPDCGAAKSDFEMVEVARS